MQTQIYRQPIKPIPIDEQRYLVNLFMQTIEQIKPHIKPIPIDEQLRLVSLITLNLVKAKKSPWQMLQEFRDATDLEALDIDTHINWRDNMSEKVKILVSEEDLIQPMTDIWEDYI